MSVVLDQTNLSIDVNVDLKNFFSGLDFSTKQVENKILSLFSKYFSSSGSKWSWDLNFDLVSYRQEIKLIRKRIKEELLKDIILEVYRARDVMVSFLNRTGERALSYTSEDVNVDIPALSLEYLRSRKKSKSKNFFELTGLSKFKLLNTAVNVNQSDSKIQISWDFRDEKFIRFNLGTKNQPPRPVLIIFKMELEKRINQLVTNKISKLEF